MRQEGWELQPAASLKVLFAGTAWELFWCVFNGWKWDVTIPGFTPSEASQHGMKRFMMFYARA